MTINPPISVPSLLSRRRFSAHTRAFLQKIAKLGLTFGFLPLLLPATAQIPNAPLTKSQAGYYRSMVGDVEVISLSDGTIPLSAYDFLTNTTHAKIEILLAAADVTNPVNVPVNGYLVHLGSHVILIDAGAGALYGPKLGKLEASLVIVGYQPEQITDIVLTHIHPDHTGGLVNGQTRVFPNAIVHLDKRELDYWFSNANADSAPQGQKGFFQQAIQTIKPYVDAGRVKTFDGATELFPGFRSIPAPGHTPGHTFYSLESKGARLIFWGDVLHEEDVQFPDPSVTVAFDVNPAEAMQTRKAAFADAANKGYLIAPAHINFPGIGHVRAEGDHYRWLPVPYVNDAVAANAVAQK
jgi:glyoxylase-like metal-dependent hydrolase (beta-lactamase superfamily II)